jgi:hypothetical protein
MTLETTRLAETGSPAWYRIQADQAFSREVAEQQEEADIILVQMSAVDRAATIQVVTAVE